MTVLGENDRDKITELLMGRKVTKVDDDLLLLDSGQTVRVLGNQGGCCCSAGDYDLTTLNGVDNVITRVEFDYQPGGDDQAASGGFYRVYVFCGDQRVNLLQVDGSDGNGWYGTGFELVITPAVAS